ncbi:MAG: phytanoyl-CoA dioxygenase family protein [Pseudomonadota bacterium]
MQHNDLAKMAQSLSRQQSQSRDRVLTEISDLGLEKHLNELETQGFTTLKGELDESTIKRAQSAILDRVQGLTGKTINLDTATAEDFEGMTYLPYLLYDNDVFAEIAIKRRPLALMTYLLGESCLLSSLGCHFKGPGDNGMLPLHSDNGNGMPAPFPPYSQVANINYALTPYSKDAGALALVPGSHVQARQPSPTEMMLGGDTENPAAVSMDLAPGDAVIWHGNTWHGSYARKIPGIRMNLAVYFARQYIQTQEQHKGVVPEDFTARHHNNERLLKLLGSKQPYGWQAEGPDYALMGRNPRGLFD